VNRLELAVKRAESTVNKEKRELAENKHLLKLKLERRRKRKVGRKTVVERLVRVLSLLDDIASVTLAAADRKYRVRARMDAIASSGGKRAVSGRFERHGRLAKEKKFEFCAAAAYFWREKDGMRASH